MLTRAAVAVGNFISELGPTVSNSQLGKFRSAISTTYDAAVGVDVAAPIGRSTLVVAMSFNMGNAEPWQGPLVGFDPAEALATFLLMPLNADLSFADLNRKVIVLKRLYTAFAARWANLAGAVELHSLTVVERVSSCGPWPVSKKYEQTLRVHLGVPAFALELESSTVLVVSF
jgi:hypothetical protein